MGMEANIWPVETKLQKIYSVITQHTAYFQVLESIVKNCGSTIHAEVATKEFMEFMKDQAKVGN